MFADEWLAAFLSSKGQQTLGVLWDLKSLITGRYIKKATWPERKKGIKWGSSKERYAINTATQGKTKTEIKMMPCSNEVYKKQRDRRETKTSGSKW
jgi:hypothetical protein